MWFDKNLIAATAATRHMLESRLHLVAAVEAMADVEGFTVEYDNAVQLRHRLDEVFMAVEDRTAELSMRIAKRDRGNQA